jgi:hypothetical protein
LLREKEILSASLKINHIMQMVFIMSDWTSMEFGDILQLMISYLWLIRKMVGF